MVDLGSIHGSGSIQHDGEIDRRAWFVLIYRNASQANFEMREMFLSGGQYGFGDFRLEFDLRCVCSAGHQAGTEQAEEKCFHGMDFGLEC